MAYVAGTDLTFEIPLLDANAQPIDAVSVEWRVIDGQGNQLVAWTPLTGYQQGTDASITVPATANALSSGQTREARDIELRCTLADGSKAIATKFYVIEADGGSLVVGSNTAVTLATAEMLAEEIGKLSNWSAATRQQKTNALIEAYRRLDKLSFKTLYSFEYDRRDSLLRPDSYGLLSLTVSEFMALDSKFRLSLAMAQVVEADAVLSDDPTEERRRTGLVLETIGEVKQMFRTGKPLELPVSRRALSYVSLYVNMSTRVLART